MSKRSRAEPWWGPRRTLPSGLPGWVVGHLQQALDLQARVWRLEAENRKLQAYSVEADKQQLGHLRQLRLEERRRIFNDFRGWVRHDDRCRAGGFPVACVCGLYEAIGKSDYLRPAQGDQRGFFDLPASTYARWDARAALPEDGSVIDAMIAEHRRLLGIPVNVPPGDVELVEQGFAWLQPSHDAMEAVLGDGAEAFFDGWTIRRCLDCRKPVAGGPTRCVDCAQLKSFRGPPQLEARDRAGDGEGDRPADEPDVEGD